MIYRGYAWKYDGGKKEKNLDDLRSKRWQKKKKRTAL
jgi:hypothetical protein